MTGFNKENSDIHHHPQRAFCFQARLDQDFVNKINQEPQLFSQEELDHYDDLCDEHGYYYNVIAATQGNKSLPAFHLSGNYAPYIPFLLKTNYPVLISNRNEHIVHMSFYSRFVICCQRPPSNVEMCLNIPVFLLDQPMQYIFPQINTPWPEITIKMLTSLLFSLTPLRENWQVEVRRN